MSEKARVIAFYLPQFHPIPENDEWWGKGFTEWTNVGKAKPLFRGHYQPHVPADLGYYDLRMPEIREAQAELAREAGIEGFCYWHYWFGNGKRILERPFNEVLASGKPDFPFCLGWANHSWTTKSWEKGKTLQDTSIIIEQEYPGETDHIEHFNCLLPAFKDKRYIKIEEKPLFVVYHPLNIPDSKEFIDLWNNLAINNGLKGIHFVGVEANFGVQSFSGQSFGFRSIINKKIILGKDVTKKLFEKVISAGFDAVISRGMNLAQARYETFFIHYMKKAIKQVLKINFVMKYNYSKISRLLFAEEDKWDNIYPTIIPNWDRTPRSGKKSVVWHNCRPEYFKKQVEQAMDIIKNKPEEHKILFLMSWNEWGEGNHVEPDLKYGKGYLEALKEVLK
ncbi:MAG: glycoside hydrolase family 99-like domain-containing protein [Marinilabiliaceae bacterium]|nr:glycoside hydrolase family 99-like domain-containing protein [Marinilabiliaceae bacterium]